MDIAKVALQTNKLDEMKNFYGNILELEVETDSIDSFEIRFGSTTVEFNNRNVKDEPYYHFAFDIPSNQFLEAKEWTQKRVPLSTEEGEDEVYFTSINAKSIYFEDPSGNIVEFISRLQDNPLSNVPFSKSSFIKMSEMSLVVQDKLAVAEELKNVSIFKRDGGEVSQNSLSFMGNRKWPVYLLLVNTKRKWFFSHKESAVFPLEIILASGIKIGIDDNNNFYLVG